MDSDSTTFESFWLDLGDEERFQYAIESHATRDFFRPAYLIAIATLWHDPIKQSQAKAAFHDLGGSTYDLHRAVEAYLERLPTTNGHAASIEATRFPFVSDTHAAPSLPKHAQFSSAPITTWLDLYASHSAYWAPRAAPAFHKAVGLWILSTIAARRIVCHMGSTPVYPTLFIALVSQSTHWTKTTAASIGIRLLRRAGCGHLLAPDRTTPQFLLKFMSGIVPQDYGSKDYESQQQARDAYGFSAQRGWFYEEWGSMLQQMKRIDSPHAELNKLLVVLEGGAESFESATIQRGLERIENPYLALLGNATPHDLAPFVNEGNNWWHDGFWPRFALITPPYGQEPSRTHRPRESYALPAELILSLHDWHVRLGSPTVSIEEEREANGKLTGKWIGKVSNFPSHAMHCPDAVYDAYEAYNDALLQIAHAGDIPDDLSPWYGRAHEKALRVAMLLASAHGEETISLPFWIEAQRIVEEWRHNLHELLGHVGEHAPLSKEEKLELKIESLCLRSGGMTARELQQNIRGATSEAVQRATKSMVQIGSLQERKYGRKIIYTAMRETPEEDKEQSVDV